MQQSGADIIEKLMEGYAEDGEIWTFIERVGPTVIGVKPASLINAGSRALEFCRMRFGGDSGVEYTVIKRHEFKVQLFIWHREGLIRTLADPRMKVCLERLGYPASAVPEELVELMTGKIQGNTYPHEIGLLFGYPIKDVYGFMGLPIPYRKTMGWRIYGDVRPSERVYYEFKRAREQVRSMMKQACTNIVFRS